LGAVDFAAAGLVVALASAVFAVGSTTVGFAGFLAAGLAAGADFVDTTATDFEVLTDLTVDLAAGLGAGFDATAGRRVVVDALGVRVLTGCTPVRGMRCGG